jgi:putative endopeptidase
MYTNKFAITLLTLGLLASCSTSKSSKVEVKPSTTKTDVSITVGSGTFDPNSLDTKIDPKDDFFLFSNGNWIKNNPIPSSESRWGSFNELEKNNEEKLTEILKRLSSESQTPGSIEEMLGNFYNSFMNKQNRESNSFDFIAKDLSLISTIDEYSKITSIVAKQHKEGINSLFGFGVGQDLKNVDKHISYMSQGGIGLPNKDYYSQSDKAEIVKKYQSYITELFLLIGETQEGAEKSAQLIVELETKLAAGMMSRAELRIPEKSYNKMSFYDAKNLFPYFKFESYLAEVGSQKMDSIIVGQPIYFQILSDLIGSQSLESWRAYLMFKTINHYAPHMNSAFIETHFKFYQGVLSGKSEMKSPNERVIAQLTNMTIGEALGKQFVKYHYSENAQKRVNTLVDNLLITFEGRIKALSWMSAETKKEALVKLNSVGRKLGFPSQWEDFSDLKLTKDDYLQNIRLCNERDVKQNFSELFKPVDEKKWGMPAHMVNAYYNPLMNEIAFPAGIMQPPFFDEKAEDAVNYGRIGMVIGHEFMHGFDDMGSKFAADGSFTNWWSEEDRALFDQRTKLLGETFANFCPIEGHCVNPDLTMGENIADLGGIILAYHAYTKTEEFKSGKVINGYTPAQRFFLSFAQLWRISYTEEELKNRIANDPHSPGMYRVNGPLMNCPEFFEAFGIKEGDKMRNSEKKMARIW